MSKAFFIGETNISYVSHAELYRKFKDDPAKAQALAFELGKQVGSAIMTRLNLRENSLHTLAILVNAFMRELKGEITAKVEGDKVVFRNRTICGVMIESQVI